MANIETAGSREAASDSEACHASRRARSNLIRLGIAQALAGANSTVIFATGAIIGDILAPNKALATLPVTFMVLGMAAATLPTGAIARRYGRRVAFLAGTACGVLTGLLAAIALIIGSFWLYNVATFVGGAYAAVVFSFRFAAADCVPPEGKARALGAVMAGGVFGGVIGPQLVTYTMNLWPPYLFAVTYFAQACIGGLTAAILMGVRLPKPTAADRAGGRPLGTIVRQPRFIIAVTCATISYMLMNLLMTSAPLAMRMCGHSQEASNLGLQWHVIAMYGPSFFTGRLITRFGAKRVVFAGLILIAASAATGLSGTGVTYFWISMALLGLGWNFGFVGSSALILECHRPEERTRVQSLNDFIVFGMLIVSSLSSGGILAHYGWNLVCWVAFPPLVVGVGTLAFSNLRSFNRASNSAA
jgi:MFS family permease